ncbi:ABC transporter permease subunit [Fictibacillus nanhaiensis]|uniref:ABC transporter permease subunit n=1 Tax=Fictibacillus nanhaiensis TaxID=742169 RepID=UPI001C9420A9|nr:ABC transporter permease subunit [Fictibacillus nanhaiensis]MBY6038060.1 ABC transporter permease subunit [Fictibacillus nanhaiensis]
MTSKLIFQFCMSLISIFCIILLPYLFMDMTQLINTIKLIDTGLISSGWFIKSQLSLEFNQYIGAIGTTANKLLHILDIHYYYKGKMLPLFPDILIPYISSLKIFASALSISVLTTFLLTYAIMLFPIHLKRFVQFILFILESLPDIFVVIMFQVFIIWLYKETDILLFQITNTYQNPALFLPIICLSILPTMYLVRILLLLLEDESSKQYVELAKGKGLRRPFILAVHIFRNALFSMFYHSKTMFWFMLSNLFMIEYLLNTNGILMFLLKNYSPITPEATITGVFMLFVPFYLLFAFITVLTEAKKKKVLGV